MNISIEDKAEYQKKIQANLENLQTAESDLQKHKRELDEYVALDPESQSKTGLYSRKSIVESNRATIVAILNTVLIIASRFDNNEDLGFNRDHFFEKYFQACEDADEKPNIRWYIEYLCKQENRSKSDIIETFKQYPPSNFIDYKKAISTISKLYPDLLIDDFPQFATLYAIWPPSGRDRYLIPETGLHKEAMTALVEYLGGTLKKIPSKLRYTGDWFSDTVDAKLLSSLKNFQESHGTDATILDDKLEEDLWLKAFWIYQEYVEFEEDEDIDELHAQWEASESDYSRSIQCAKNEEIDRWYGNLLDFERLKIMEFLLSKINRKRNHFSEHISIITSAQITEFIFEVFRALVKFADYPVGPTELYDLPAEEEELKNAFRRSANVDFDFNESTLAFVAWKICHIHVFFCTPRDYEFEDYVIWDWAEPEKIKLFWVAWVNKFSGSLDDPKTLLNDRDGTALDAILSWLDRANDFKTLLSVASILKSHPDTDIASEALQKLSKCALEGNGMLRSKKKALAYLLVAKVTDEQGHNIYTKRLREQISDLEDEMSQEQISLAEELAEKIYEELSG